MMNMSTDEILKIIGYKQLQIEQLQKELFEARQELQMLRDRFEPPKVEEPNGPQP